MSIFTRDQNNIGEYPPRESYPTEEDLRRARIEERKWQERLKNKELTTYCFNTLIIHTPIEKLANREINLERLFELAKEYNKYLQELD